METGSFLFGVIVGLAAGFSPGPLTALVAAETLRNGKKEGFEVAISPLISELPIVVFVLMVLSSVARSSVLMGVISLFGACFMIYLGLSNLIAKTNGSENHSGRGSALLRGITLNLLNPNMYMFWFTIGGPAILESARVDISSTILLVLGFYIMLVGSKTVVAVVVERSKAFVKSRHYVYVIRALGIVLIVFALIFVIDALESLGIL